MLIHTDPPTPENLSAQGNNNNRSQSYNYLNAQLQPQIDPSKPQSILISQDQIINVESNLNELNKSLLEKKAVM